GSPFAVVTTWTLARTSRSSCEGAAISPHARAARQVARAIIRSMGSSSWHSPPGGARSTPTRILPALSRAGWHDYAVEYPGMARSMSTAQIVKAIVDVKAGKDTFRGQIVERVSDWTARAMEHQTSLPVRFDREHRIVLD